MKIYTTIKEASFTAKSKASGKVVNFASQQNRDNAIKSGEYEETDGPAADTAPAKPKVNIFDKPKPATQPTSDKDSAEPKAPLKAAPVVKTPVDVLKSKVEKWSDKEKAFFRDGIHKEDSPERRNWKDAIKDKAKGAIAAIKKGAKHEVEEFKAAGAGVKNFFSGKELSEHEKKALKAVAIKVATTAIFGAVTGGAGHGVLAFGKHVAMEFIPHVVGETILKGAGTAALFAGDEDEDAEMERFMQIIADKMASEKITPELMTQMVDSYNAKKDEGDTVNEEVRELTPDQSEMVQGIIDMLLQIDDIDNRMKVAQQQIQNFKDEEIVFNYAWFLSAAGLDNNDEPVRMDVKTQPQHIINKESIMIGKINEDFKHIIHVDTPTQVVSKPIAAQVLALAKKGIRSKDIGLEMGFVGNAKLATDAFQKVKNKIYFELGNKNESVNEGSHGMATKLLQSIVSGDSSRAEGTKMSKELAQHYIDWIRTSPFGKKNSNLPLDMLVKASFNWGIERGLDSKLKGELSKLKQTTTESVEEATTSSAPGEWVAYLSMTRGKKLLKTFDTARGAKQFLSKNVDKLLGGANVESVGIMTKQQWDEREAKYAVESVNEAVDVKAGGYRLVSKPNEGVKLYYDGKVIATGFYDMDDWYFWMQHSNWKGSDKGFNNPKEIINYFRAKKITTESVNEVKYPTNLYVGSVIYGQGFTGLKGIEGGKYYKVVEMDDTTATLVPCDQKGKITGSKKVRHKLDSIEGGIKTAKRGDENGIVVESVNEERILVRKVMGDDAEKFLKKYPKVKQVMSVIAKKNTDLMKGYKAFLKFKDAQEDYLGGRAEVSSSPTFGSKTFYKYDWGNLKNHWPEVYQYIYTLHFGGLDGATVEGINEAMGNDKSMLALVDILSNSMEYYEDDSDFLQAVRGGQGWSGIAGFKNSSLIPVFKSIYKKYWTVSPQNRTNWITKDWINWLKPFGLEENVNSETDTIEETTLNEKQFKGLEGIPANKSLEKISKAEKLNIIKAKGNIISFIVPDEYKGKRNFWQVISAGNIKKSSSGNIVMLMGGGPMNSPSFKNIDDLINGVDWKSMEEKRRFNESVTESTPGEQIQNLNNRLTKLRQDMAKAKSPEAKNVIQARMKNALQKLSDKKKDMGIKKP